MGKEKTSVMVMLVHIDVWLAITVLAHGNETYL